MAFGFDILRNIKKVTALSLIFAFLSITLFPLNFHLHHDEHVTHSSDSSVHHVTDMHGEFELIIAEELPVILIIDPASDVSTSKSNPQMPLLILFAVAIILLPRLEWKTPQHSLLRTAKLRRLYSYFTPPLRAPPHA